MGWANISVPRSLTQKWSGTFVHAPSVDGGVQRRLNVIGVSEARELKWPLTLCNPCSHFDLKWSERAQWCSVLANTKSYSCKIVRTVGVEFLGSRNDSHHRTASWLLQVEVSCAFIVPTLNACSRHDTTHLLIVQTNLMLSCSTVRSPRHIAHLMAKPGRRMSPGWPIDPRPADQQWKLSELLVTNNASPL